MPISAGPETPTESSIGAPASGISYWWRVIGDWLKSLSPNGATQYDTGWVTTGLTITTETGWTLTSYAMQRIGRAVQIELNVTYSGPTVTTDASGNTSDVTICTLPAAWIPARAVAVTIRQSGLREWFGQAGITVTLSHGLPSQTLNSGTPLKITGTYFVV